ncbi:Beta-tubulin folding cofactor C [Phaffia rhodozyma]|uniref:Beta-tubulin folding cofactor C n=1 Tax=Phaffia rhodozyma TaxID=264483 RepID=A0A0F7SWA5_PHARH|nr:Beta-tubulin folding cofactor C [Phaffia rhodozyma]
MSTKIHSANLWADIQASSSEISQLLAPSTLSTDDIQTIQFKLASLKRTIVVASDYIPKYDQRNAEAKIKELETEFESKRTASAPKSKFSFKKQPKPMRSTGLVSDVSRPTESVETPLSAISIPSTDVSIHRLTSQYITLPTISADGFGLSLFDLTRCVIDLFPSNERSSTNPSKITALHIKNLKQCVLIAPILEGSIMISDCAQCVLILGGWQFRMHTSSDCKVFIHSAPGSSTPIIEGCRSIRFGSYLINDRDPLGSQQSLKVLDFSHPNPTVPSPNWSILSVEEERAIQVRLPALLEGRSRMTIETNLTESILDSVLST